MKLREKHPLAASAFTLIELILVMVLLTIAVAFAAPRLSAFFRGRALDSEARRLLALTRYAQDRAASEGVPMRMWFDSGNSQYGVRADQSYEETDPSEAEFQVGDRIELQVRNELTRSGNQGILQRLPTGPSAGQARDPRANLPSIRFLPEGLLDPAASAAITLEDADGYSLIVAPAPNHLHYEIKAGTGR